MRPSAFIFLLKDFVQAFLENNGEYYTQRRQNNLLRIRRTP
ncbi:hypothetical protein [Acidithiobacillus sulfurivorans]|nr:hypothetical protein [Acidithiobacillus sulfurivorans]